MNSCRKCVVSQHHITAQFYAGPKGFVKVSTVMKTRNTPVGRELWQHISGHYCYQFWGRQTYHWGLLCKHSAPEISPKKLSQPTAVVVSWCVDTWYDNARPHIAQNIKTVPTDYKCKAQSHSTYSPNMSPPDFNILPKLKELLHGQQFQSFEKQIQPWPDAPDSSTPVDN